jgi:hypothetical protein
MIVLILSGCQSKAIPITNTPTLIPTETAIVQESSSDITMAGLEPYDFKVSDPGFITIKGYLVVFDPSTTLPDPNDAIFLVPMPEDAGVVTIPPFTVGEVPQAEVDERTGNFVFTNIEPGQYAVVVLTMGQAQMPARYVDDGSLAIIKFSEADRDQVIKLEYIGIP